MQTPIFLPRRITRDAGRSLAWTDMLSDIRAATRAKCLSVKMGRQEPAAKGLKKSEVDHEQRKCEQ